MLDCTVIYTGPPALGGALAHSLRENGIEVLYNPPVETHDLETALAATAIVLAVTGNATDIYEVVRKFVRRFTGAPISAEVREEAKEVAGRLRNLENLKSNNSLR